MMDASQQTDKDDFLESPSNGAEIVYQKLSGPSRKLKEEKKLLRETDIGRYLCSFFVSNLVSAKRDDSVDLGPAKIKLGRFFHAIHHGGLLTAPILGHELRHIWQHFVATTKMLPPTSLEEYVALSRFMEADARAIGFGLAAELSVVRPAYSRLCTKMFQAGEREICQCSFKRLCEIGSSKELLHQGLRDMFDEWTMRAPECTAYEDQTFHELLNAQIVLPGRLNPPGFLRDAFALPDLKSSGIRSAFIESMVANLGVLNKAGDNYLLSTRGEEFTSPLYTRVSNFRLERLSAYKRG